MNSRAAVAVSPAHDDAGGQDGACTCSMMIRRGRPPEAVVDPECPLHGWQDAALAVRLGALRPGRKYRRF